MGDISHGWFSFVIVTLLHSGIVTISLLHFTLVTFWHFQVYGIQPLINDWVVQHVTWRDHPIKSVIQLLFKLGDMIPQFLGSGVVLQINVHLNNKMSSISIKIHLWRLYIVVRSTTSCEWKLFRFDKMKSTILKSCWLMSCFIFNVIKRWYLMSWYKLKSNTLICLIWESDLID